MLELRRVRQGYQITFFLVEKGWNSIWAELRVSTRHHGSEWLDLRIGDGGVWWHEQKDGVYGTLMF